MSIYMNLQPNDREALNQLECDHSLDIDEIECVIDQVKLKFKKFHLELERKEDEIMSEINRFKEKTTDDFVQKKSRLFDTNQNREIKQLSTRINLIWRKNTLDISDICEIQTQQRRRSHTLPSPNFPYGDLTKFIFKIRESQILLNGVDIHFPLEMHSTAKQLIKNKQYKYPLLPIYNIIRHNIKRGKSITDLQGGILSLSKYAICLFVDPNRVIFHTIQVGYIYGITFIRPTPFQFKTLLHKGEFDITKITLLVLENHIRKYISRYISSFYIYFKKVLSNV